MCFFNFKHKNTLPFTYQQSLNYLYHQLPMFQRVGPKAFKKDLSNIIALCSHLNNVHQQLRCIHIGGTNGKGSTAHALSGVLQTAGLKVGLYTSPHYVDFRERIKINGQLMDQVFVINFVAQHKAFFEELKPSFFEITVAMAFAYFAEQQVDVAIIEVGLGGRLDSTNIITPDLSVITNISYDHTKFLGNTLPLIAGEKAGIIKQNIPVVIGETQTATKPVFQQKAIEQQAPISFADQLVALQEVKNKGLSICFDVYYKNKLWLKEVCSDLIGGYQLKNICTVLASIKQLQRLGYSIKQTNIRQGLGNVKRLSRFMGRWQLLQLKEPTIVADSAHNPAGISEALLNLGKLTYKQLHWVLGVVNDKEPDKVLQLLPRQAKYYFCRPDIPRGLAVEKLQQAANKYQLQGKTYPSVNHALAAAKIAAKQDDLIFIAGSIYVLAEVLPVPA